MLRAGVIVLAFTNWGDCTTKFPDLFVHSLAAVRAANLLDSQRWAVAAVGRWEMGAGRADREMCSVVVCVQEGASENPKTSPVW